MDVLQRWLSATDRILLHDEPQQSIGFSLCIMYTYAIE